MQFKKTIFLTMIVLVFSKVTAQKLELGKVTIAELQEREHPKDPSAAAAILFRKGDVKYEYSQSEGFVRTTKVQVKIKIYKKEGYNWADAGVRYYSAASYKNKVQFSDAVTYNLVDGKIVKTKLSGDGQFDDRFNKYLKIKKITMPNVKEGSVLEYEYTISSPGVGDFGDWNFQSTIPVNYSEYRTAIPEIYVYKTNQRGFIFPKISVERIPRSIYLTTKERGFGVTTDIDQQKFDYVEVNTAYISENLPALRAEAYVNNIDNYTASISHELSMTQFPNRPVKNYSEDWDSVTKTIYNNDDFGTELNKTGYFEADLDAVIKGLTTRDEKISAILNYLKSAVKWDEYSQYSCDAGVKQAYKNKTGNVAEINLMLIAMLRYAGINANPVLVSTRANGIAFFPSTSAFNYVIAAVEIPNDLILLDATDKFSQPNVLPLRDLNWFGRLIRKDGSSTEVDLMPKTHSKNVNYMNIVLKGDGSIDGKIRRQTTDYEALQLRQKTVGANKDAYIEELENKNNAIEISDYTRDNDTDLAKPVVETFSFKDLKDTEIIDGKIYFSPMLFLAGTENPFKQEKREYPVDYGYPHEVKYILSIEIPQGYAIQTMPEPISLVTADDIAAFKYNITSSENKIQVTITSDINAAIVSADYYDILKGFYQKMIDKQNEKIILIKKS